VIKEMTTYIITDLETTSLDPSENGRVTCISTYNFDDDKIISFWGQDEIKVLSDFWNYIENLKCPTLVTFNGSSFDIPYLIHRSIVRSQKISKYNHIDLRHVVNSFFTSYDKRAKGTLGYWAAVLGIQQKTPGGAQMIALFLEKKYDEIEKHCSEDVCVTKALFERLKLCGLIPITYQNTNGKY
jgi:uncharacterized protein YprB with RNaseH-like and TPR domain